MILTTSGITQKTQVRYASTHHDLQVCKSHLGLVKYQLLSKFNNPEVFHLPISTGKVEADVLCFASFIHYKVFIRKRNVSILAVC